MEWRRLDGRLIHEPIVEAIQNIIEKEQALGYELTVCIGSDSQVKNSEITFATVIVFLRKGKGGFMLVSNEVVKRTMTIKERMMHEVILSVGVAYDISDLLAKYKIPLEVHVDINPDVNFKSNVALKEAMGYILSMGYVFKAKPNAFASSSCADKVC